MSESLLPRATGIIGAGIQRRGLFRAAAGLALGGTLISEAAPTEATRKRKAPRERGTSRERAETRQSGTQGAWRYCNNCRALHSAWDGTRGTCPAGGLHNVQDSYNYLLHYGDVPSLQGQWRYCVKCRALHSIWDGTRGPCPAGGLHSVETSLEYRVFTNSIPNPDVGGGYGVQGDWRYCKKCRVLHSIWDGNRGVCAAGGLHSTDTSVRYQMLFQR